MLGEDVGRAVHQDAAAAEPQLPVRVELLHVVDDVEQHVDVRRDVVHVLEVEDLEALKGLPADLPVAVRHHLQQPRHAPQDVLRVNVVQRAQGGLALAPLLPVGVEVFDHLVGVLGELHLRQPLPELRLTLVLLDGQHHGRGEAHSNAGAS